MRYFLFMLCKENWVKSGKFFKPSFLHAPEVFSGYAYDPCSIFPRCYAAGLDLDPLKLFPPVEFPVPRGTPMISPCISKIWDHSVPHATPHGHDFATKVGTNLSDAVFDIDVSEESEDHYIVSYLYIDLIIISQHRTGSAEFRMSAIY